MMLGRSQAVAREAGLAVFLEHAPAEFLEAGDLSELAIHDGADLLGLSPLLFQGLRLGGLVQHNGEGHPLPGS